jgi:2-methylaconitate isomerase
MQTRIPTSLMRGGTSRGLFFRSEHLPDAGALRDAVILRAYGSPDPYGRQIDGLGGGTSVTSKVAIISRSNEPGCDVDYFFGQVDIKRALVDYTGSCGNLSAAVGPFAIEEGLVETSDPVTTVRIWQVNTGKRIVAHVPTAGGAPLVDGEFRIAGIPFPGAAITLEYLDPGGSCTAGLLPTGRVVDELEVEGLGRFDATLVDATNPVVFVRAADLGLTGTELGDAIDGAPDVRRLIESVRAQGSVLMGLASSAEEATANRPGTPKVAFVAPPASYRAQDGGTVDADEITLLARIMSMGMLHRSYAVTGGIATAAAAAIEGSVVQQVARRDPGSGGHEIRIGHPSGVLPVGAEVQRDDGAYRCLKGIAYRTARRLMEGAVCVPASVTSGAVAVRG